MDAPAAAAPVKIRRWLPYWAVFQADVRQTLQSWVYRTWVLVSVLVTVGYSLYRYGAEHEAGILQSASQLVSDLLRWTLLGGHFLLHEDLSLAGSAAALLMVAALLAAVSSCGVTVSAVTNSTVVGIA